MAANVQILHEPCIDIITQQLCNYPIRRPLRDAFNLNPIAITVLRCWAAVGSIPVVPRQTTIQLLHSHYYVIQLSSRNSTLIQETTSAIQPRHN